MYTATFTFAKKQFDERFQRLDDKIACIARETPGYLGEEAWENPATGLTSTVYYWDSLEALAVLMHHPIHLEAKASQAEWLAGYRVVIAQVIRSYGDDRLEPVTTVRGRSG
jgi:heme-degrading monooxygenase HmoA